MRSLENGASIAYDCSMDFRERLQRATNRGQQARDARARDDAAKALSEAECQRLHRQHRAALVDHIERCLKQLADNFPGFSYEDIASDRGWGGAVRRDDLAIVGGRRENQFSRLEIVVSPHNQYHVLDVTAKGAVRNKENFSRNALPTAEGRGPGRVPHAGRAMGA